MQENENLDFEFNPILDITKLLYESKKERKQSD